MIDEGKRNVLGVGISAIDYEAAVDSIFAAAHASRTLKVTALAVHGVMTGVLNPEHRWRLNRFDIVTPDGQPVRWALNLLHGTRLRERVYGPELMARVCKRAARENVPVFLFGSRADVLKGLRRRLKELAPGLTIAGARASLFRATTAAEKQEIENEIRASGAKIVFVGLGCPRQEVWAHEYAGALGCPTLTVGAAFDFHAGILSQAPVALQNVGLEWLYRLVREPRRLWRRYLLLNPAFLTLFAFQAMGLVSFTDNGSPPTEAMNYG